MVKPSIKTPKKLKKIQRIQTIIIIKWINSQASRYIKLIIFNVTKKERIGT